MAALGEPGDLAEGEAPEWVLEVLHTMPPKTRAPERRAG